MAAVEDPHSLIRREFSEVAKLTIQSHPATPISLACSGYFHISAMVTFAPYPQLQEEVAMRRTSLLTWTSLLQRELQ